MHENEKSTRIQSLTVKMRPNKYFKSNQQKNGEVFSFCTITNI